MISDVLFEAIGEIRRYQREFPEVYEAERERIDAVVRSMEQLEKLVLGVAPAAPVA